MRTEEDRKISTSAPRQCVTTSRPRLPCAMAACAARGMERRVCSAAVGAKCTYLVLVVVVMVMATVFVFVVSVRMSIVVAEWFVELGGGERSRGTCRSAAVGIRPRQEGVYSKSGNG